MHIQESNSNVEKTTNSNIEKTTPVTGVPTTTTTSPSSPPAVQGVTTNVAQEIIEQSSSNPPVTIHLPSRDILPTATEEDLALQDLVRQTLDQTTAKQIAIANSFLEQRKSGMTPESIGINQTDEMGQTPLMHAVYNGNTEAVKIYCAAGADVNLPDHEGFTPLMAAASFGNQEAMTVLEKSGASWAKIDNQGMFAERYLEQSNAGKQTEMFKTIEKKEAKLRKKYGDKLPPVPSVYVQEWAQNHRIDENAPNPHAIEPRYIYQLVSNYYSSHRAFMPENVSFQDLRELISFCIKCNPQAANQIMQALDEGSDLLGRNPQFGFRPFPSAVEQNNKEIVEILIKMGANSNDQMQSGETLLNHVITTKDIDMARLLLKGGIDANRIGIGGLTPLCLAAKNNDVDMVDLLVESKADINLQSEERLNSPRETPLTLAIRSGQPLMVNHLLNAKANPNKTNSENKSPLYLAVAANNLEIVEDLLKKNRAEHVDNINLRNNENNRTALDQAILNENLGLIRILLNEGARPNVNAVANPHVDYDPSLSPLTLVVKLEPFNPEILQALVAAGADINAPSGLEQTTPLAYAITQKCDPEVLQALVAAGADINAPSGLEQKTPLLHAITQEFDPDNEDEHHDYMERIERLLNQRNIDLEATDGHNFKALDYAAGYNDLELVNMLLERGAIITDSVIEAAREHPELTTHLIEQRARGAS